MSSEQIDSYIATLSEPHRSTLADLRKTIRELQPEVEESISYGMPAFRLQGKVVAGFAAFKQHVSYFPHSGSVLPALQEDLKGYEVSKGSLRFSPDAPLPRTLVKKLLDTRIAQEFASKGSDL